MKLGIGSWTYPWAIGVAGFDRPAAPLTAGRGAVGRAGDATSPPRGPGLVEVSAAPLDAFGLLGRAAALGVGLVQIADNLPLELLPGDEIVRLGDEARRAGIELELGTRGVEPCHLARFLELAECLGACLVRTLTHRAGQKPGLAQVERWLGRALPAYERAGITLALENYEKHTVEELACLVERIASPHLGICLDPVNSLGALETPAEAVRRLGPLAVSVHVKDFDVARVPSMMGYLVTGAPAGTGRLDIPWLLAEIRRHGRKPNAVVEQWPPFRRSLDATVALEAEWAEQSVGYLRQHIHG